MRPRVKVIANPISGRGKAGRIAPLVIRHLQDRGCEMEYAETRRRGDARRFAADVAGYSAVVCIGGDGTVNEVLNGLPPEAPPIAFIPSGTANVLAKELRLPWTVTGLANVILDGRAMPLDVGVNRTDDRKFLLFAGAGFDSFIVEDFHCRRKGRIHMSQYFLWGLKTFLFYHPPRLTVEVDGDEITTEASWVEVSNVSQYGGPLVFTPGAHPADGVFEIMIQLGRRKRDLMRIFWAALLTFLLRVRYPLKDVLFLKGRKVRIRSTDGRPTPVQIDGDPGGELPADLELCEGGVKVLAPRRAAAWTRYRRMRSGS